MDPGELNSKSPGRNVFDPGNLGHGLFGATAPSTASLYAHYAHLPNSLSLLSHPSAFPAQLSLASSAFGGLGALTTPVTSAAYTSSPGAAWWPMASRLLAPDYLMRSLVASATNTTFVNLSRDSVLPGYDVLSQPPPPHHPPPHKINCEYKSSSSRRKASSSLSSSPSLSTDTSSTSRNLESSFSNPIYTHPSSLGVTLTPISYDKKSYDLAFQPNGVIMPPTSTTASLVASDPAKIRQTTPDRHFMSPTGHHTLPVTVVTKDSSNTTTWKSSKSHNPKKLLVDSALNESHKSETKDDVWDKNFTLGEKRSCVDQKRERNRSPSPHLVKAESLVKNKEEAESLETNAAKEVVACKSKDCPTTSTISYSDRQDLSAENVGSAPLNLSLKIHDKIKTSSPPPPNLKQEGSGSRRKKSGYKPKSNSFSMASLESIDHNYNQDELRAHLEAQLKQQQLQLRMAKRMAAAQKNEEKLLRSYHLGSSEGRKSSTPDSHVAISSCSTTLSSHSHTKSNSPSTGVTAASGSSKGISLLTGAPAILSSPSDLTSIATNRNSGVHMSLLSPSKSRTNNSNSLLLTPESGSLIKQMPSLVTPKRNEYDSEEREKNGTPDDSKKLVARFRTLGDSSDDDSSADESSEDSESSSTSESSSSESESDSDTSGTEDAEKSQTTSAGSTPLPSMMKGQKRIHHDNSGTSSPSVKRRRLVIEEMELRIPLEHGWRRQTKIRTFSYSGIRGTVTYFAACGKKLKTYPEVIRYLDKNKITDITRENFSFSSRVNIGEYLEPLETETGVEYVPLGVEEVVARLREMRASRGRRSAFRKEQKKMEEEKLKDEIKNQKKLFDSQAFDLGRKSHEHRVPRRPDKERALLAAKEAKKIKAIEEKQRKEHLRLLRQQEKYERQEQIRIEKEMRAQQMLEARKKRQEELEKQRVEEATRKAKEREMKRQQAVFLKVQELQKRREMLIMVDLERERRRQHMLLVKALEAHKKQEERERIREERKNEKRLTKERKMEQRKLELEALRELRKPVEDMEIMDAEPVPNLNRIPGVKLPGKAFADILMVVEFLHNFGETLGFDMQNLPTLNTIQMAMLNNENAEEELVSTMHHLLTCAIEDPGPPINTKHLSVLSQSLKEVDITGYTLSEVLRIFIRAFSGENNEMCQWLKDRPYLSLNATQKASILAFICNELLCSRAICRQIDNSIELVTSLRKDKWMIEGNLRKLKSIQNKKLNRSGNKVEIADVEKEKDEKAERSSKNSSPVKSGKGDDDEGVNESGNESEGSQMTGHGDMDQDEQEDEEDGMSSDELKKQIDKFGKQMNQCRGKLVRTSQQLRAMSFGQDRYKRRYWVLPFAGGVFGEGMESAEQLDDDQACDKLEVDEKETTMDVTTEITAVKQENENDECSASEEKKLNDSKSEVKDVDNDEVKTELAAIPQDNLFLRKPEELGKLSDYLSDSAANSSSAGSSRPPSEKNGLGFGPLHSGMLYNGLPARDVNDVSSVRVKSEETAQNHSLMDNGAFDSSPFSMEQVLKPSNDSMKPWFSLLPRMPCDETTLTRLHVSASSKMANFNNSAKYPSSLPYNAFNMYGSAPTFASLQMGVINGAISSFMNADHMRQVRSPLSTNSLSTPIPLNTSTPTRSTPTPTPFANPNFLSDLSIEFGVDKLKTYPKPKPVPIELQRGWWRITDVNQLKLLMKALHQRGIRERMLYKQLEKYEDFACQACGKSKENAIDLEITDLDRKISECTGGAPDADDPSSWSPDTALRVDLAVLEHVETLEERLINSSMQVKNWKPSPKVSGDENVTYRPACVVSDDDSCVSPVDVARQRLLELEPHIEPRYIKPPLGHRYSTPDLNLSNLSSNACNSNATEAQSPVPDDLPPRLVQWRDAVQKVETSAQLAMCLSLLEICIAWDKSIMKASCQFCNSGDNEAMLLLCDGCDKGYHTYCFKPKMDTIPDGDWFCNECINKATGDRVCMVCSKKGKNLLVCDGCPKAYHIDCLEPPLSRLPKGKWSCSQCNQKPTKNKTKSAGSNNSRKKENNNKSRDDDLDESNSRPEKSLRHSSADKNRTEKSKDRNKSNKDFLPCKVLLSEMETHEDAWPFLLPVNTKQFPSYRKVIKKLMDFSTMRSKIADGSYKSREEFSCDARLIFDNCETFNEDDSPVGKAGHNMRAFFESRWGELTGN